MPRSTTSIPALQYQPLISSLASPNAREKRRQLRSPPGARSLKGSTATRPNFVSMVFSKAARGQAQLRNARVVSSCSVSAPARKISTIAVAPPGSPNAQNVLAPRPLA